MCHFDTPQHSTRNSRLTTTLPLLVLSTTARRPRPANGRTTGIPIRSASRPEPPEQQAPSSKQARRASSSLRALDRIDNESTTGTPSPGASSLEHRPKGARSSLRALAPTASGKTAETPIRRASRPGHRPSPKKARRTSSPHARRRTAGPRACFANPAVHNGNDNDDHDDIPRIIPNCHRRSAKT